MMDILFCIQILVYTIMKVRLLLNVMYCNLCIQYAHTVAVSTSSSTTIVSNTSVQGTLELSTDGVSTIATATTTTISTTMASGSILAITGGSLFGLISCMLLAACVIGILIVRKLKTLKRYRFE